MKHRLNSIILFFVLILITTKTSAQDSSNIKITSAEILKLYPVLWQQNAAEYRALCYQAFYTATAQLNLISKKKLRKGKLVIVTDLDETILDNSYLEASLIKNNQSYSDAAWKHWTDQSEATAVPGAVEFLQYAKQKGIDIFYISNRDTSEIPSTFINLKKLQLPDADTAHMLFLSNTSSKETRRQIVSSKYEIVMLLGDNLNDFMNVFEKKNIADRLSETDNEKQEWGKRFIVLPNCTYGEFEGAWCNYNFRLSSQQKIQILMAMLKVF